MLTSWFVIFTLIFVLLWHGPFSSFPCHLRFRISFHLDLENSWFPWRMYGITASVFLTTTVWFVLRIQNAGLCNPTNQTSFVSLISYSIIIMLVFKGSIQLHKYVKFRCLLLRPTSRNSYWHWFALEIWCAFSFWYVCYVLCDHYSRNLRCSPDDG